MRWAEALLVATLVAAGTARAEYVSDPAMCEVDGAETGMRLDASAMWTVEYTCEWDGAVDFTRSDVQLRLGYCSEPGPLFPTVFAFQAGAEGDGTLWVHEGNSGEPQRVFTCAE